MKTDGKFIITSGGITQGIQKELGLSNEECEKLKQNSVWDKIINELDDSNNLKVQNNNNIIPSKSNNYEVCKNAIIELSAKCWKKIVTWVNTALNKNIEIVKDVEDNAKSTNNISPKAKQLIEKLFGKEYTIDKVNAEDEEYEYYTISSLTTKGNFFINKSTGDFEFNLDEKQQTISSFYQFDKNGNLKQEPYVQVRNMRKILDGIVDKNSSKIFENAKEFLNYLIQNVGDIGAYSELLDCIKEDEYSDIFDELSSTENREILFKHLETTIDKMGNEYKDLKNLLNKDMNLSQLLSIAEFAYVRQNYNINNEKPEWNADGKLFNKSIEQGGEGDCWFISFLYSAYQHEDFQKLIEENTKIDEKNKTYTVKFRGIEYTYTFDEIQNANEFSVGDMDVRVWEMAARDFFAKEKGSEMYNPMASGGFMETAAFFFGVDDTENVLSVKNIDNEYFDQYINLIKGNKCICTTSTDEDDCQAVDEATGETVTLDSFHEMSVVGADDKYVYLINPQGTKSRLRLEMEEFRKKFSLSAIDLDVLTNDMNKYE